MHDLVTSSDLISAFGRIETMGVLTHIFAIILALRQRNKLIEERALKTRESKVIMPLV